MERKLPDAFYWFSKLNNTKYIPWRIDGEYERSKAINSLFRREHNEDREVETFGARQDMDTFCGFEVKNGVVQENVIVFHPSFQPSDRKWDIIESEHSDIFDFMVNRVLPEMKEWIKDDEWEYYEDK